MFTALTAICRPLSRVELVIHFKILSDYEQILIKRDWGFHERPITSARDSARASMSSWLILFPRSGKARAQKSGGEI